MLPPISRYEMAYLFLIYEHAENEYFAAYIQARKNPVNLMANTVQNRVFL